MHPSSMENMRRCVNLYLPEGDLRVIDLGSSNVNGSYRELIPPNAEYLGLDLEPGPGVDIVLTDPYRLPLEDESIDVVLSGQMLEHCAHFWRVFTEISRVIKPSGLLFSIAPSAGPIHRFPVDCYRFYLDAYQALADWAGLRIIHCWLDERGPWRDLVGVFQKGGALAPVSEPPPLEMSPPDSVLNSDPAAEVTNGQISYLQVLARIHEFVRPKRYVEIGIRMGNSLKLCQCDMVGVDPFAELDDYYERLTLYPCTSDDFFFFFAGNAIDQPVDLAFIDGMHLLEFVYRDFMNLERLMSHDGVIVIDDVLPNHPLQANRKRQTRVWTGDVWRIVPLLQQMRPDLRLTLLDTAPSGLLVISSLDPKNRRLWDEYNPTLRGLMMSNPELPQSVLSRAHALAPSDDVIRTAIGRC